ncbi:TetR/AcrR family transcriptional regulator [Enhygromyxa salina]|nr:TetR/AcrR family transcriptional regulator [Enhygromyxa salina]
MASLTANDWALAALETLGVGGVAAVRVEVLARDLGVTKGSYYHHFKNRRAVLELAVQMWEDIATEQVIIQVNASSGDPRARLLRLARATFLESGRADAIESAIREWASADTDVAQVVARVDARRLGYVEDMLCEAGVGQPGLRAELFYRTLIGEFVWRRHGGPALSAEAIELLVGMALTDAEPVRGGDGSREIPC